MASNAGKWVHSANEEVFGGGFFDTKEDAIADGKEEYAGDGNVFYVGQVVPAINIISVDADSVIDNVIDQLHSEIGEVAEDALAYVHRDDVDDLTTRLTDEFKQWLADTRLTPGCYKVENMETIDNS